MSRDVAHTNTRNGNGSWVSLWGPLTFRTNTIYPELTNSIKWGNPAYEKQGLVWYLAATKGYDSLGFFNGAALADPEGILA